MHQHRHCKHDLKDKAKLRLAVITGEDRSGVVCG